MDWPSANPLQRPYGQRGDGPSNKHYFLSPKPYNMDLGRTSTVALLSWLSLAEKAATAVPPTAPMPRVASPRKDESCGHRR